MSDNEFASSKPGPQSDPAEIARSAEPVAGPLPELPAGESAPVEQVECWRCGKSVDKGAATCKYCRAPLSEESETQARNRRRRPGEASPLVLVMGVFTVFLVTTLVYGLTQRFELTPRGRLDAESYRRRIFCTLGVEFVDTLVVVVALAYIARPPSLPDRTPLCRAATWAASVPALAGLLAANVAYHVMLKSIIAPPEFLREWQPRGSVLLWSVLAICVQPAIVEELFFRYLVLGSLLRATGVHGAVLISSVMFGIAHIGVPLSVPYLIVLGVALGYTRLGSGGLVVPMLMHFVHNGVVLYLEHLKHLQ